MAFPGEIAFDAPVGAFPVGLNTDLTLTTKTSSMIKKTAYALLAAAALLTAYSSSAHAQMLTISEVYGGGGNAGSTYKNDFLEIYNYGTTAVDVSTFSVYYASATGAFSNAAAGNFTQLTGTIAAGSFYLIQEAVGAGGTTNLPTPNATGTIALSATAGKIALGLTSTVPSGPTGTGVIDFVGFGATASQFEGTGPALGASNTLSINRMNPATDTNQNASDYTTGSPSPGGAYIAAVPEPATYAYIMGGLGMLFLLGRRRRLA